MIISYDYLIKKEVDKNIKPLIDNSFIEKNIDRAFIESIPTSIFLKTNKNKLYPIILLNDFDEKISDKKYLIVDYKEDEADKIIKNIDIFDDNYKKLLLFLNSIILEKKNIELQKNLNKTIFYKIFSIIFLLTFFHKILIKKPSIVLYLLFLLVKEFPIILEKFESAYPFYFILSKNQLFNDEFFTYLILVDADKALLFELQKIIEDFNSYPNIRIIFDFCCKFKLNKNRLRRLFLEIYRILDMDKFDYFIDKINEEKVFFDDIKITPSQKEIRLSKIIDNIINPLATLKYDNFNKFISSSGFSLLNIKPSLFFERNEISISANIRNKKDFEILKKEIDKLLQNKDNFFDF